MSDFTDALTKLDAPKQRSVSDILSGAAPASSPGISARGPLDKGRASEVPDKPSVPLPEGTTAVEKKYRPENYQEQPEQEDPNDPGGVNRRLVPEADTEGPAAVAEAVTNPADTAGKTAEAFGASPQVGRDISGAIQDVMGRAGGHEKGFKLDPAEAARRTEKGSEGASFADELETASKRAQGDVMMKKLGIIGRDEAGSLPKPANENATPDAKAPETTTPDTGGPPNAAVQGTRLHEPQSATPRSDSVYSRERLAPKTDEQLRQLKKMTEEHLPQFDANARDTRHPQETRDHYAEQARQIRQGSKDIDAELAERRRVPLAEKRKQGEKMLAQIEAEREPGQPSSVGAQEAPKVPLADEKTHAKTVGDQLHAARMADESVKKTFLDYLKQIPKEVKEGMDRLFYGHAEGDPLSKTGWTEKTRAAWDQWAQKLVDYQKKIAKEINDMGQDVRELIGQNYMHRIQEGHDTAFERAIHPDEDSRGMGGRTTGKAKTAGYRNVSSMHERLYHAVEFEDGTRQLVALKDGKLVDPAADYKDIGAKLGENDDEMRPGAEVEINGKKGKIGDAFTREIEDATGSTYQKSFFANTIDNIKQLEGLKRGIATVKKITETPEWEAYARKLGPGEKTPAGSHTFEKGPFKGWTVKNYLADTIKDATEGRGVADKGRADWAVRLYQRVINGAVRSLFYSPLPHGENVEANWFVSRGWDWVDPKAYPRLVKAGMKAYQSVIKMDKDYHRVMNQPDRASALMAAAHENRDFHAQLIKGIGGQIARDAHLWTPVANAWGFKHVHQLVKALYDGSEKMLWRLNDGFMLAKVYENEAKGMSTEKAIADAEKTIVNYRVGPEVLKSRGIKQALTNPLLMIFSNYHIGNLRALGNIVKPLIKGSAEEKGAATGRLFALAIGMTVVRPLINGALHKLTGNKNSTMKEDAGMFGIPLHIFEAMRGGPGDHDLAQILSSIITLNPAASLLGQGVSGMHDYFGRPITEKKDPFYKQLLEGVGHAADALNAPIGQVGQGLKEGVGGVGRKLLQQSTGVNLPSDRQIAGQHKGEEFDRRDQKAADKNPRSGLMTALKYLEGLRSQQGGIQ